MSLLTALSSEKDFKGEPSLNKYPVKFKCVASYYPFTSCLEEILRPGSIFEDVKGESFRRVLGGPLDENKKRAKQMSPTEYLNRNSPPILLIHGDKDSVLPIINSTYLKEIADKKHADVELLRIKNAEHSFNGSNISPSLEELSAYSTNFILSKIKE